MHPFLETFERALLDSVHDKFFAPTMDFIFDWFNPSRINFGFRDIGVIVCSLPIIVPFSAWTVLIRVCVLTAHYGSHLYSFYEQHVIRNH